jgi:hypothetical protein
LLAVKQHVQLTRHEVKGGMLTRKLLVMQTQLQEHGGTATLPAAKRADEIK